MKTFIRHILGHSSQNVNRGVLGKVSAYYGCVEAQGRGSLHCHMMVWIEGALDPNAIRSRIVDLQDESFCRNLIKFLDDAISNAVPPAEGSNTSTYFDPPNSNNVQSVHPCQTQGIFPLRRDNERQRDLHDLVQACQTHRHGPTCYKYWKGPPEPKACRFDLDPDNVRATTTVDEEGNILLRCVDGMINNFNETIIECVRCNMDIKFIASGRDAKAIMYYITDYVTKTPLTAHASYVALEAAVKRLKEGVTSSSSGEHESSVPSAATILQRCAFSMLGQQEISAQQVASELLGLEDHFTSHQFRNLFWLQAKNLIDA
ncbi:hypothetical protein SISNIDRAFT_393750, partial [Sistotremastrum niveocremeum HHB9708]